ncbi:MULTISPECIES: N-acetyltransferase [Arthrobacter]|uniref:GNAT family N-acetyltransferase n=1 Tax=Arthrobacter jinronghuae TaxID=2964609 RepID=A0ABT1NRY8_9MICC|nr:MULTISPECIES: GNAT family N-acetyltransferase [Arthrobacter]MCQ1949857.1 GNAT family N-acetyltransferase [Arthrobacter jinronghuae]MCQ1953744.1 GNAT family N-acetyltransferase [Arthrobacter sp. zg-Y238]MCQ1957392.1 GNAT family N-acetyltransferase [Arthrobacter jinronghuae]UWX80007.1 GNAT family N-acetyltransferase [Arthrobacter jinronghuae]
MTAPLSLRRRTVEDLETIINWIPDDAALLMFTGPRMAWPPTGEQFADLAAVPGLTPWVLCAGRTPAFGQAELRVENGTAHIARVIIDPLLRGRGLSQQLIRLVLDQACAQGARSARLKVTKGNTVALRAYRRLGFVIDPRAETAQAWVLELDLGQPAVTG